MIDSKSIIPKIETLAFSKLHEDWSEELFKLGIWNPFSKIYDTRNLVKSNIVVSFIVCAFNGYSNMVHLDKDRLENKKEILLNLGANEKEVELGLFDNILYNGASKSLDDDMMSDEDKEFLEEYLNCIRWYMHWQKDSKWRMWISKKEFVSVNTEYANKPPAPTKQIATKTGTANIDTPDTDISAIKVRKSALMQRCSDMEDITNKLEQELKVRYSDLETISSLENDISGTDLNVFRLEDRLAYRKNKIKIHE